jgi:Flp pilus assembly pilin Flp
MDARRGSVEGGSSPVIRRRDPRGTRRVAKEVNWMTFSDWIELTRASMRREEGQTMAEYGVVLAVITVGAVAVFTALSGGITGAISRVIGYLPT